jgi:polyisoprenoid-binding protein YceI
MAKLFSAAVICTLVLLEFLAAEALALPCPVKLVPQQLAAGQSSISFKFKTAVMSGSGRFTDYVGRLSFCPADVSASSLTFVLDASEVRFESMPPEQQLLLAGVVATLSNAQVKFQSTAISKWAGRGSSKFPVIFRLLAAAIM